MIVKDSKMVGLEEIMDLVDPNAEFEDMEIEAIVLRPEDGTAKVIYTYKSDEFSYDRV